MKKNGFFFFFTILVRHLSGSAIDCKRVCSVYTYISTACAPSRNLLFCLLHMIYFIISGLSNTSTMYPVAGISTKQIASCHEKSMLADVIFRSVSTYKTNLLHVQMFSKSFNYLLFNSENIRLTLY